MNETEHVSQLSALFDNELPASQADLVVRRALKDSNLRDAFSRYSLIGASMRGEPLAVGCVPGDDVASRVSAFLAADSSVPAGAAADIMPAGAARAGWVRGAFGLVIAASVAAVSLLVLRGEPLGPEAPVRMAAADSAPRVANPMAQGAAASAADEVLAANAEPPSYTTPIDNSPPGLANAPLVNYVVAHSDLPASVVRFSPLSSVMSASYDPAQGAVEMSEAEIGAHR